MIEASAILQEVEDVEQSVYLVLRTDVALDESEVLVGLQNFLHLGSHDITRLVLVKLV